jgi:hypothetical protein
VVQPADPALRALWSLGGAPAAALRALERLGGGVEELDPERLGEAEEIAQAVVAPLLAPERGVAGRALERAVARREGEVPEDDAPKAVTRDVEPGGPAAAPPPPRRAPKKVAEAPSRAVAAERPPRALDAGSLEKMAGHVDPEEAPRTRAPVGRPARGGRARPVEVSAADARAALSLRAERARVAGALHAPVGTRAGVAGPPEAPDTATPAALVTSPPVPEGAQPLLAGRDPAEWRRRLLARPAGATPGEMTDRARRNMLSAEAAREALARRAEKAGARRALQTTVVPDVEAHRRALLERAQAPVAEGRARPPAELVPHRTPGPALSDGTTAADALERALARLAGRTPRRAVPAPQSAAAPEALAGRIREVPPEGRASSALSAREAPLEGLAGLAARASAAAAPPGPPPVSLAGTAPPQPPIPAALAERMEEAQLARRLERILRREAEQAGVDLEELDP